MIRVPLTKGLFAIVDDADAGRVLPIKWYAQETHGHFYARSLGSRSLGIKQTLMHRFIVDAPGGQLVDHINGDSLDNRRENLRLCTVAENNRNTRSSPRTKRGLWKGIYWHSRDGWRAVVNLVIDGVRKKLCVGRFSREIDAALAYDHAARKHFGEFAACNYPDES